VGDQEVVSDSEGVEAEVCRRLCGLQGGPQDRALAGVDLRFMTQFLASFGEEPDHQRYSGGGGNSFIGMARELLDGLDRPLPPLDKVVLAYHVPDMSIVEVAGCYLAERCPGNPQVFSVAGQGVGAPFTALRVLSRMYAADELAEGAVLVLDQSTLPYFDADTHTGPSTDCAVLLSTDSGGGQPAVEVDFVDERVAGPNAVARLLSGHGPRARVVVGRMLADLLDPRLRTGLDLVEGARDRLCTSAWAALAAHWAPDRYTVVADYDPHSGRLFRAGLRPGAAS
ncbi:hypothetical protein ABZ119_30825, partial [Streptomyces sp. NPDC006288]|uniref:hypothetical protein n=1 Tax=Streptomyces sp. NPDC006288 TaxID=3156743 RepID=UPI0033A87B18